MERKQEFIDYFLIVGLGNPGDEFVGTAHNIGRDFLVDWAKRNGERFEHHSRSNSLVLKTFLADRPVILLLPENYMNRSGIAVLDCLKYFKINLRKICVIHDDSDQYIGALKLVEHQSSAGHKGVESVISSLKNKNFTRLKVGIRPPDFDFPKIKGHIKAERFVLKKINDADREKAFLKMENALSLWLKKGVSLAMNIINRKE